MKLLARTCLAWLCAAACAGAAEPYVEFLDGLRERGYHDVALEYLDQIAPRGDLPADTRDRLLYERGRVLLDSAADPLTGPEAQRQRLDAAQAAFDQFTSEHPNHALAPRANADRAKILLSRARVDLWDSDKPENESRREEILAGVRTALETARENLNAAQQRFQAQLLQFPSPIPEEDRAALRERNDIENQSLSAGIERSQCLYYLARTFPRESDRRRELLTQAAAEFEQFRQEHRSTLAGLYAGVWQGKCFEEQGDYRTALGHYATAIDTIREDDANGYALKIRDLALRYTLTCLNSQPQAQPAEVIARGERWMAAARSRLRTEEGLGIQWEVARAHETLGQDRSLSENDRNNHLTQSLNLVRTINRFPGEFKSPSTQMISRLMRALGRQLEEPKDFETAYVAAGQIYDQLGQLKAAIQKAQAEGRVEEARQLARSQAESAVEMTRLDEIALRLAAPDTDPVQLNLVWLRLSYGYILQQRFLDATALAEYLVNRFADSSAELALEAGYIGVTSLQESARESGEGDLDFEIRTAQRILDKLLARWPQSERTLDVTHVVAGLRLQQGDDLAAAELWGRIPESTPRYAAAQVRAGLATWRHYANELRLPAENRPPETELADRKSAAIAYLERGLAAGEATLADNAPLPADLFQGKLTLAGIRNLDGVYSTKDGQLGALELLTDGPHSVIAAVTVPAGQPRPTQPEDPRSRQTASFAYRQLLRTQVGLNNLDAAREARAKLEEVASGEDGEDDAALTQVFVQFGRQLEEEIDRLKATGQVARLAEVRSGFEAFLNDIFQRTAGQTFYSLLWMAETYTSLAESSSDQPDKAAALFNKAAASYQAILEQAAATTGFATPQQLVACKLRLVNCLRKQKNFPKAEQVMLEVVTAYPNAPNVQFEMAQLYQDWGSSGAPDAAAKFDVALYGSKAPVNVWGWTYAAQTLRRSLQSNPGEQFQQMNFDAWYHLAEAELAYAQVLGDKEAARTHLQRGSNAILNFQRTSKRWPEVEYQRFNRLYQQLQAGLGIANATLARELQNVPAEDVPTVAAAPPPPVFNSDMANALRERQQGGPRETPRSRYGLMVLVIALGLGAVVGMYFFALAQGRRKRARYAVAGGGSTNRGKHPGQNPAVFPGLPGERPRTAAKPSHPRPAGAKQRPAAPSPPPARKPGPPPNDDK